jgi:hypothetical protein
MGHITDNEIDELVYFVLNKKILSDRLRLTKKHMSACQECYERFCVSLVLAHDLHDRGVMDKEMLLFDAYTENVCQKVEESAKKILLRFSVIAGKIKYNTEKLTENINGLWDFEAIPELAYARGDTEEKQILTNKISEFSSIIVEGNKLTIRLDDELYDGALYEVVIRYDSADEKYSFSYNEMEETYELVIQLKSDAYQLEIREK